jgi:hypothetical protein
MVASTQGGGTLPSVPVKAASSRVLEVGCEARQEMPRSLATQDGCLQKVAARYFPVFSG